MSKEMCFGALSLHDDRHQVLFGLERHILAQESESDQAFIQASEVWRRNTVKVALKTPYLQECRFLKIVGEAVGSQVLVRPMVKTSPATENR